MKNVNFQLCDLLFPSCVDRITTALIYQKGVFDVRVISVAGRIIVTYDEDFIGLESIKETILNIGYEIESYN